MKMLVGLAVAAMAIEGAALALTHAPGEHPSFVQAAVFFLSAAVSLEAAFAFLTD